jgi:hypothetical protein
MRRRPRFLELKLVPLGIYRPRGTAAPARAAGTSAGAMRWHRQLLAPRQVRTLAAALAPFLAAWPMGVLLVLALAVHVHFAWTMAGQIGYRDLVTYAPGELLALVAVSTLRCLLHELGHAAACLRLAGSVGGIGCGVFITTPVLYCDVSDIHLLPRRDKAAVGMAGTAMDLVVLALWAAVGGATPLVMKIYAVGMIGVLLNVLPFYRNDGYWVLNDLAGGRDLLKQALQAARAGRATAAQRLLLGFTACGLATLIALATAFALHYGPQQVAEVMLRWPEFPAVVLAGITALQYAALVFGVLAATRMWIRLDRRE